MDMDNSSSSAAAVMRAMVRTFDTGDLSKLDAIIHPDDFDHQGLPQSCPMRGIDGFREVVEMARGGYSALSVEIADLIEGWRPSRSRARVVGSPDHR